MLKKPVYLALCVLINLGFLLTAYEGRTQGVINLPQTSQAKCYNASGAEIPCAGTGQDGELQVGVHWPDPRFTVSGDCVTDNLTGLMWAKNGNLPGEYKDWRRGTRTWDEALDYIASINSGAGLCGYKDWRLPNVNELESLVNAEVANSATWLYSQGFVNVQSGSSFYYWSSTTNTEYAWIVNMWDGFVYYESSLFYTYYYVWPVRSGQLNNPDPLHPANVWKTGQTTSRATGDDGDLERGVSWPAPRFTDHGDGTVTDKLTGLMWAKNANLPNEALTWQGALDYVKALNSGAGLGGYHDWRLPNRKELFSLIDHSTYKSALLPAGHPFQNVHNYYSSSTTDASNSSYAWIVDMRDGCVYSCGKSDNYFVYVWPVRSGQGSFDYPDISVTPNSVTFGNVSVGATSDQTATIKNDGNANLVVGTITQPGQPFSKIQDNCSGQTIAPNATCTVMYRFAPTTSGNFSSSSNIPSNDPDENPVTVTLNGTGWTVPSITVSKSGTGTGTVTSSPPGIDCGSDCSEPYNQGTIVTLTATPDAGSTFWGWSGDCSNTGPCAVTMNASKTVTAIFQLQPTEQYSLTVNKTGTGIGTVTSDPSGINCGEDCNEAYNQGTNVTLTATPASGSTFGGWSGDADCSDGVVVMNANKTCTATFNPQLVGYTLTVIKSGTGSGTVTSSPAGINCGSDCSETYTKVQKVKLTAKADATSTFTGWSDGGCSGTKTCTVTVDSEITVTASFALKTPDISVSPGSLDFGSVKPGKKVTKTLKITNNGTGDLVITLSGLEDTDFSIQGSSSVTIKAKKSYTMKVLFRPTSGGLKTATLEIHSNDPDTPTIDISLSGTGQ
jgi:hypothetical protein